MEKDERIGWSGESAVLQQMEPFSLEPGRGVFCPAAAVIVPVTHIASVPPEPNVYLFQYQTS